MRKWEKIVFLALALCLFSGMTVHADQYKTRTWKVDLNGDGKKENVKSLERWTWNGEQLYFKLYINSKLRKKAKGLSVRMIDLNKKDKYKELCIYSEKGSNGKEKGIYTFYRYASGKFKQYASAYTDLSAGQDWLPVMKKNGWVPQGFYSRFPGNGRVCAHCLLYGKHGGWIGNVELQYKASGGLFVLDQNAYHRCLEKGRFKAYTKLYAYIHPRTTSNKLSFTLKKGELYRMIKMKIMKQYSYLQVQKGAKKGWIVLKTSDLYTTFAS